MDNKIKVCTIGGGTGMPVINQALVRAGFKNIKSIVTTFDNGGDTGRIRTDERGKVLAFSDYWRALISLWNDGEQKSVWEEMLRYRDGKERNFGNVFFQFMSEKTGNLSDVDSLFCKLTGASLEGKVIPVSLSPADICFSTISGKKYFGEHYLDDQRMSQDYVNNIWLEPEVEANPEAIETISNSDVIIVCPGSVYGSLITNFLPKGMKKAFAESKAKKILMVNVMLTANENLIKNQADYLKTFEKYLEAEFDIILMADVSKLDQDKLKKVYGFYAMENSTPVEYSDKCRIKTDLADIVTIDENNWRLRHSETKLADYFAKMDLCHKKD
ncbi:MAG: 2-phospho-L-lactate transferase CofD family protein [Candidatus Shapirobacteria bacterium]|jgi:uncharacterized cofD-like protein